MDKFHLNLGFHSKQNSESIGNKSANRKFVRFNIAGMQTSDVGSPVPRNLNEDDMSFSESDEDQRNILTFLDKSNTNTANKRQFSF
eukprot:403332251